ncbi:hypothetical protein J6590_063635 [Homalodisca vitripennis]|nr:hypothetical protein J6590_063635 [Homalodisca vitripennis]
MYNTCKGSGRTTLSMPRVDVVVVTYPHIFKMHHKSSYKMYHRPYTRGSTIDPRPGHRPRAVPRALYFRALYVCFTAITGSLSCYLMSCQLDKSPLHCILPLKNKERAGLMYRSYRIHSNGGFHTSDDSPDQEKRSRVGEMQGQSNNESGVVGRPAVAPTAGVEQLCQSSRAKYWDITVLVKLARTGAQTVEAALVDDLVLKPVGGRLQSDRPSALCPNPHLSSSKVEPVNVTTHMTN